MKLQHIAAAVALVAAGAANASIADIASGNSSLFMIAYDNAGGNFTTTSSIYDLGYNLTDFTTGDMGAVNNKVVWDFAANTITRNGAEVTSLGTNDWSGAFDKLLNNVDAGQLKWTIGAGDKTGSGANVNYLVSGQPTSGQLTSQNGSNTTGMSVVDQMYAALNNGAGKGTIVSAANGAFTFAAADGIAATRANGYVIDSTAFSTNWAVKNQITSSISTGTKNNLWQLNGLGAESQVGVYTLGADETITNAANLVSSPTQVAGTYAGTFIFNATAKTLTWETAAITANVPEASTYSLALVGMVLAGVVARRRRAA
jgi:hypothetical protein